MHVKISLDLTALDNATFSSNFYLNFDNITYLSNWHDPEEERDVTALEFYNNTNNKEINVFLNGATTPDYTQRDDLYELAETREEPLILECDIPESQKDNFYTLYSLGIITLIPHENKTLVIAYRLNSERDYIEKTLKFITIIEGSFKAPLGIKNIDLDVVDYDIDNSYNYVYFPKLKRYYYITNIQLITNDYTRLLLQEDVLMSWKTLIKQQNAFVNRYENAIDKHLVDERYPVKDIANISYYTPTNVSGSSVTSFKFVMDTIPQTTKKAPNVLLKVKGEAITYLGNPINITPPSASGLPEIQSKRGSYDHYYLLSIGEYNTIVSACIKNDAPATYIHSALLLPFDLRDLFDISTIDTSVKMYVGNYVLDAQATWKNAGQESEYAPTFVETYLGGSPYIVVADFMFNSTSGLDISDNYLDYAPNTLWEIYLPFVGWITLDARQLYNARVKIYYTFDFDTGLSTAYIYNQTNTKIIWAGSCQLGMKLSIAVSNAEELARQKQATSLNLIMGLMSSALSIGAGAYSGNAVAVMGGIMGASKTITSAVNTYNAMIEKGQITTGSPDNSLYSTKDVVIRKTTHSKVLTTTDEENNYKHLNGYPFRDYVALSTLTSGYVEIGDIHFDPKGQNIYNAEIDEIVGLLKGGVIF